jgi:hypothetical protein
MVVNLGRCQTEEVAELGNGHGLVDEGLEDAHAEVVGEDANLLDRAGFEDWGDVVHWLCSINFS